MLPSASAIYVEGRAKFFGKDGKPIEKTVTFNNNFIMFLFQDIRYEINGIEIDRIKNSGITTTIKSYISLNEAESKVANLWVWNLEGFQNKDHFSALIPLNMILGFAEDHN